MRRIALSALLATGCVIPGLTNEDEKECPCAADFFCDAATNMCVRTLPIDAHMTLDASDSDAGTFATVDGETLFLAAGWSAQLFVNFSNAYKYDANNFTDTNSTGSETDSNAPRGIVPLVPPFHEGFAVLIGRQILEIPTAGSPIPAAHDFTPTNAGTGACSHPTVGTGCLDWPNDLYFATVSTTNAYLLDCSNSYGGGDGISKIDSTWTSSVVNSDNNVNSVAFDATGVFDDQPAGQTYFAWENAYLERLSDEKTIIPSSMDMSVADLVADIEILRDGKIAVAKFESDNAGDLMNVHTVTAQSGVYTQSGDLLGTPPTIARLVTGDLTRTDGILVLESQTEIDTVGEQGGQSQIASTPTGGWKWVAAAIPPMTHSLGMEKPVVFVLSSNRSINGPQGVDHILALTPP